MIRVKNIILPLLISVNCFTGINSFAQQRQTETKPDQYRYINWTKQEGLPNEEANTMFKDAKGFLWIGSAQGALCRFDGMNFKKYLSEKEKRGTINSDKIHSFKEDSLHNIWIGTIKGLSRYDTRADTFTNFVSFIDPNSSNKRIIPFWATKNQVYCIESGLHIVMYDIYSFKKKELLSLKQSDKIQESYIVLDTLTNSLWLLNYGTAEGGDGLLHINLNDSSRKYYSWTCYRNIPDHGHGTEAMQYDPKRNSIWINSPDGLLEFSMIDKQFHLPKAFNEIIKLKDYDRLVGIDLDIYGRVWLATKPKGILIYDPATNLVRQVFSDPVVQQKAAEDNLHIYCDRDGIIWTSNWQNHPIYELLPFNTPFKRYVANANIQHSLSNNKILSIIPAAQGKVWIGTDDGLNIFDPVTEKFEVLRAKDLKGIKGNTIVPIGIDTIHQKAWLSTNAALYPFSYAKNIYEMDIKNRKCRSLVFRDGTKLLDSLSIVPGVPGYCLPYKNGFLLFDDNHGVFEIKGDSPFAELVIPLKVQMGHSVLKQNRFLFLNNYAPQEIFPLNFTFENKNGKWIRIPHLLDSLDWWNMLYIEKDQSQWVCFKNELVHYDKDFRKIKSYGQQDGYNSGNIFNMLEDNEGNIWFNNDLFQISRLNTTTGVITTLSEVDGYYKQPFDWSAPAAKDARGNLYFGVGRKTVNEELIWGLDRIYPERYASANSAIVYLNSLAINQKPFPLSVGVNSLEELTLHYNQNTITIETGIIDFYSKGKGRIRYKLEGTGKNENWQYGPAYYTIRYDGLVPGNYKFVIQATNAGNEFNGPEKILLITINPPFWQTWWFRILAAVAFITLLYVFIQYRSQSLKKRNIQLEEKVAVRTKELKLSLEDLRQTQAQLIQSEKMASLGELTAGIAHEIQNPLNFVNNFSEVNSELIVEMKQEIEKGNFDEVKIIAKDIEENEQKINHHGKRADAIVKGMLQHSRSSSGVKEPTDINALCDKYLRLSYHGIRAKDKSFNATLITDFDPLLEKINIIPQDIGRVILNLLNNAFYAVQQKQKENSSLYEPSVSVSTKKMVDTVEIKVSDNGNGIPQKIVAKIFQPFFTTKPTGQGTGLGLSLSYDIIKAHGGEIKVETKEGEGSEFIIQLPVI